MAKCLNIVYLFFSNFTSNIFFTFYISLLYLTFTFNFLYSTTINGQPSNSSEILYDYEFYSESEERPGRYRRYDALRHTPSCEELDKTEDTPFVVIIITRNPGRLLCMGSIIDEYHVLTAKKCFDKNMIDASTLMMIAGYKSPHFGRNSQVKYANRIILHEKELAIIKLERPYTWTQTVQPIRLIGPEKMDEDKVKDAYKDPYGVVGFDLDNKLIQRCDYLPKISAYEIRDEIDVDCNEKCIKIEDKEKNLHFCTNISSGLGWTTLGSPAVIVQEKEFIQIGVIWAVECKKEEKKYRLRMQKRSGDDEEEEQEEESEGDHEESKLKEKEDQKGHEDQKGSELKNKKQESHQGGRKESEPEQKGDQDGPESQEYQEEPYHRKNQTEKKEPDLYYYIRTDKFYKWIKANSYIGR